jgi:hypothetical protein
LLQYRHTANSLLKLPLIAVEELLEILMRRYERALLDPNAYFVDTLLRPTGSVSERSDAEHSEVARRFDPLGEAFCTLRSPEDRRADGATYTPGPIVRAMVDWAASQKNPERIVDPGTGSGRFLIQAAQAFPKEALIGVDTDPL